MEYVTAADVDVPALGFGTARMDAHEERRRAVSAALDAGYRHIDTAQIYGSEPAVSEAVSDATVDREELFLTTKLADDNRAYDDAVESTRASLDRLDTDYVDLLLIHSPNDEVPHAETLRAMNDLRDDGLVRHVGVSNFSVEQLREAMDASEAPILTNQVEYHVRERRDDLLGLCVEEGVMLTAYSPLDVGGLADDGDLGEIGDRYGKTAAQVALRWLVQQPMVSAIPMSANPEHIRSNLDIFDFEMTADEMERLFERGGPVDGIRSVLGL
ncbi:aldo/keto reductase [Halosimplex marinum]|uniref:aldo/keto reductase n=1 Tax=Halosimplex marinum TaxID=3396620 RepID=UPI003F55A56D